MKKYKINLSSKINTMISVIIQELHFEKIKS